MTPYPKKNLQKMRSADVLTMAKNHRRLDELSGVDVTPFPWGKIEDSLGYSLVHTRERYLMRSLTYAVTIWASMCTSNARMAFLR